MPELNFENVRFRRAEVIELLKILPVLKDMGAKGRDLAIELEARLDSCRIYGLMAKQYYTWEESIEHIAFIHELPPQTIDKRINEVLRYISGWNRKQRDFKQFRSHKAKQ